MRFGPLGLPEIIFILLIVLLLFGAKRLPEIARGMGQAVQEFRKSIRDMNNELHQSIDEAERTTSKTTGTAASNTVPNVSQDQSNQAQGNSEKVPS